MTPDEQTAAVLRGRLAGHDRDTGCKRPPGRLPVKGSIAELSVRELENNLADVARRIARMLLDPGYEEARLAELDVEAAVLRQAISERFDERRPSFDEPVGPRLFGRLD